MICNICQSSFPESWGNVRCTHSYPGKLYLENKSVDTKNRVIKIQCECGQINYFYRRQKYICNCGKYIVSTNANTDSLMTQKKLGGREAWDLLHKYAIINKNCWNPQTAEEWLSEIWEPAIPTGCSCVGGWINIRAGLPADFSSPEAFFLWTVQAHNKVNEKLNKPTITYEEACLIHGF